MAFIRQDWQSTQVRTTDKRKTEDRRNVNSAATGWFVTFRRVVVSRRMLTL